MAQTIGLYFNYSLVIHNGLDEGTQLPFIRRAKELGYAVLVLNTNDNTRNDRAIPVSHFPVISVSLVYSYSYSILHKI